MNKKIFIIIIAITILMILIGTFFLYRDFKEKERIRNAIIKVDLVDNLELEFGSNVYLSDLIENINGNLVNDFLIKTNMLGEGKIKFYFINEENIKVTYEFVVKVVDKIPPLVWLNSTYTVTVGFDGDLLDKIMCGDNLDDNPFKEIIGEYDFNKVGTYPLIYRATDKSGNVTLKKFDLIVKDKTSSSNNSNSEKVSKIYFSDLYNKYKTHNTKIGIDVSRWQGDIDFNKVKDDGVEFVFIKVGGTNGIDGDYYLDPKFKQNIEGFLEVGIPVGIYFYSYANSVEKAVKDAKWVINQIKDYDVTLPIAYDWENWSSFNKFNISFYKLTNSAKAFIDTVNKAGYKGILYSSKSYLESIWEKGDYPVWLAHYTSKTNYKGNYDFWQMTSSCTIDGITSNTVDVDIMYLK